VAEVAHVFVCPGHRLPMREIESAEAVENRGLTGCGHARAGSMRQILLIDLESLERVGLRPGIVKENVTIRGLDLRGALPGQRLRIGEAEIEIVGPCEPCSRMEEIRGGLQEELKGQRGVLGRIVKSGKIRRGDRVDLVVGMELGT
jgi:MOSC domain-containing protein YiiM